MIVAAYDVDNVFILELKDTREIQKLQANWDSLINRIATENRALYMSLYRGNLGIPDTVDIDEESSLLHEKYGDQPSENLKFTEAIHTVGTTYESQHKKYPEFEEWADQCGYTLTRIEHLIRL